MPLGLQVQETNGVVFLPTITEHAAVFQSVGNQKQSLIGWRFIEV